MQAVVDDPDLVAADPRGERFELHAPIDHRALAGFEVYQHGVRCPAARREPPVPVGAPTANSANPQKIRIARLSPPQLWNRASHDARALARAHRSVNVLVRQSAWTPL